MHIIYIERGHKYESNSFYFYLIRDNYFIMENLKAIKKYV